MANIIANNEPTTCRNLRYMDTAHIYVYGEVGYWQAKEASDWGEVNLTDIRNQYEAQKEAKNITVHIHSPGGYVTEGFAIHDYLRSLGKPITTIIEGMCYSIATVIALAGDKRLMTSNSDFMIHNPWGGAMGDSAEIQQYADDLKKTERKAADFYAAKTSVTAEEALELMKAETFMTAEQALEKGFITEIAMVMKAVALLKTDNKNKMADKAITKEEVEGMFEKFSKKLNKLFKTKQKNILIQDANGTEINFTDVEEGEEPEVGSTATVEGSPAEGEYTMPNGDVFVFAAGIVESITPAETEEEDSEEVTALKADIEAKDAEILNLKTENQEILSQVKSLKKNFKKLKSLAGEFEIDENKKDTRKNKKEGSKRSL